MVNISNQANKFADGNIGKFVISYIAKPVNDPNARSVEENPSYLSSQWKENYHYNNPASHSNDIETILPHYTDGKLDYWDVYYLWNPQQPGPKDQWYDLKTTNFSHFIPANSSKALSINNVAIPDPNYSVDGQIKAEVVPSDKKDLFPWSQVAGGSVINNKRANGSSWIKGTDQWGNPISPDAKLAYISNYNGFTDGCYLAYANPNSDGTYHQFKPYSINTAFNGIAAGADGNFRDPYVTVNPSDSNELIAYIGGGLTQNIYVDTSTDAVHWTYHGDLTNHIGATMPHFNNIFDSVEAPYEAEISGTPVLFFSAQNNVHQAPEIIGYVTGHLNNGIFQPDDNSKYGVLDKGFDGYAGNGSVIDKNHLVFIDWLGNWQYFNGSHIGGFSLPRILNWNGKYIEITPIEPGNHINDDKVPNTNNQYQSSGKVCVRFNQPTSHFNINLSRINDSNVYVGFNNGNLTLTRKGSANGAIDETKTISAYSNQLSNIEFYLDNTSVEVYVPETHQIYSILDFNNTRNAPYTLSCDIPAKVDSYQFNLLQAPQLDNINNITSKYSADKAELNKDMNVLNSHTNDSVNNLKNLLNGYFGDIQNAINDANTNIAQVNNYNGDARQHVFIALANNDMDIANTKLYQAGLQLKNLDNIATPYLDASAADTKIANYYKTSVANSVAKTNQQAAQNAAHAADENIINQQKVSVANSVNAANQQKANQAAQQADQRIAQQQRASVANSVAAVNRDKANHAAQVADQNILNQQKQSIANSVNAANQRTATSAANSADKTIESSIANSYAKSADNSIVNSYRNSASASVSAANSSYAKTAAGKAAAKSGASSADKSIESSIANSYAKSADTSIANSYKNSVDNSVRAANQSKANSAAKSADTSIANSAGQSADQSIENSEANNASQQISSQSQQPVAPLIPMDNVIPTPTAITSNSVTNNSNNDNVMNNNSSDLNSSVATSSNVNKNITHHKAKPVTKKSVNNQIPLLGLAKRTYFYQHDEAFIFTNRMKKRTNVLQAMVWPNHHVVYRVRIGKRTGYMYGYLKELVKPELFTKRNMYIHAGKRMIKLPMRRFNRIKINRAVRYAGKNYVNYGRNRGVIYGKLPKITKRIITNKGTYSKYYQVIPKRYHYVNVKKPLLIYNKKHFTKRNHRGSIRKGITIRVKRLVRDGNMTRFELMNGRYITGLKSFTKLIK